MDKAVQEDGSLDALSPNYIHWKVGDVQITLDGIFTVKELEAIIAHIKEQQKGGSSSK